MCEVTKCCCCQLRTGCYVIGAFTIAVAVINIALSAYQIHLYESHYEKTQPGVYIEGVAIALAVIYLITGILLIIGASQRRKRLLLPWMVMVIVFCVLIAVEIILHIVALAQGRMASLTTICILVLEILLKIYCFSVVRSFHKNDCYNIGETRRSTPPKDGVYYTTVTQSVA